MSVDKTAEAVLEWEAEKVFVPMSSHSIAFSTGKFETGAYRSVSDLQAMAKLWLMKGEIDTFILAANCAEHFESRRLLLDKMRALDSNAATEPESRTEKGADDPKS